MDFSSNSGAMKSNYKIWTLWIAILTPLALRLLIAIQNQGDFIDSGGGATVFIFAPFFVFAGGLAFFLRRDETYFKWTARLFWLFVATLITALLTVGFISDHWPFVLAVVYVLSAVLALVQFIAFLALYLRKRRS